MLVAASRRNSADFELESRSIEANLQYASGGIGIDLTRKENVQRSTPNIQRRTQHSIAAGTDARDSIIRCWAFDVGCSAFSAKLGELETTERTAGRRARLQIASAEAARANEELVSRPSHDVDDDRRYATLDRFRFGDRNFLRIYAAVSAEDIDVDRRCVDFPLQQDRRRDCGNTARCSDLGNAGNLSRRIPVRLLDTASPRGATNTFSPVSIARLRALACVFTGNLAHLLARVYWFALPFYSFRDHCLFSDAPPDQPRQSNAGQSMKVETVAAATPQRVGREMRANICAFGGLVGMVPPRRADPPSAVIRQRCNHRASVCESERAA